MEQRDFYGPLNVADGTREGAPYDKSLFEHPEDPDRYIVRPISPDMYMSDSEMHDQFEALDVLRQDVGEYGLQMVDFDYIQDEAGEVLQVVEKVPNATGVEHMLENGNLTDDQVREIDVAIGSMASYFSHAAQDPEGSVFSDEMLRLNQAVYSPDREQGTRVVIVDVEPFAIDVVFPGEADAGGGVASYVTRATAHLVSDACRLKQLSGRELDSKPQVEELLASLGANTAGSKRMVQVLRAAFADGRVSEELKYLADFEPLDEE